MKGPTDREGENRIPAVLDLDHVFEALAHPRRRYLLYTLLESEDWSLRSLARKVTAWEQDTPPETLTEAEIDRTYVSLYHNHVPKLADDDIVDFDETAGTLEPAENAEQVLDVLASVGGVRDSKQEDHARGRYDEGFS